jgi:hypothetical protein
MEELKRLSKIAYSNVSNTSQSLAKMSSYTRGLYRRTCSLNSNVLYFSKIKWFFETTKYHFSYGFIWV